MQGACRVHGGALLEPRRVFAKGLTATYIGMINNIGKDIEFEYRKYGTIKV